MSNHEIMARLEDGSIVIEETYHGRSKLLVGHAPRVVWFIAPTYGDPRAEITIAFELLEEIDKPRFRDLVRDAFRALLEGRF